MTPRERAEDLANELYWSPIDSFYREIAAVERAIRDAVEAERGRQWVAAAPEAPGWYWFRAPGQQPKAVRVWRHPLGELVADVPDPVFLSATEGAWCGPITPPEAPQ
jgi:hypothetical protein